jgi:hypothetical protein
MDGNASTYSRQLKEKDEIIERYRLEVAHTKEELLIVRERERSQSTDTDNEIRRLGKRLSDLEAELAASNRQRDVALSKAEAESRARLSLSGDLKSQTKDELSRQKNALDRLSRDLERAKVDKQKGEDKISSMESTLRQFQAETKEKVGKVINHHNDSAQLLEKASHQNRALEEENKGLERIVGKLQRERDSCYRSLELGRERLASIVSKSSNGRINGELHFDGPADMKSRVANADMISHVPELYLTAYSADQLLSLRAEEIAACLAVSAKDSIQESHDEASHLRSQVYRLEEEKEAEVARLKARIHSLDRELVHGEAVKGRPYGRRSRHLIDPTD